MSKICRKCGYERQSSDQAPDYECPRCAAVYAKVEARISQEKLLDQDCQAKPLQEDLMFVQNVEANSHINKIRQYVPLGHTDQEIASALSRDKIPNLRQGSCLWTAEEIEQIRIEFSLSDPSPLSAEPARPKRSSPKLIDGGLERAKRYWLLGVLLFAGSVFLLLAVVPKIRNEVAYQGGSDAFWNRDIAKAINIWTPLGRRGHSRSQYALWLMYNEGIGIEKDQEEALMWLRMAADHGEGDARKDLGDLYQNGLGVPQDNHEAVKWYRLAAEQGVAGAQFSLGGMYYQGKGVAKDQQEALRWLRMAAEQGHAAAKELLRVSTAATEQEQDPDILSPNDSTDMPPESCYRKCVHDIAMRGTLPYGQARLFCNDACGYDR